MKSTRQTTNGIRTDKEEKSVKKLLSMVMAGTMLLSALPTSSAWAETIYYKQHQSNAATMETLEEAHKNAPVWLESEYEGRSYVGDPALDKYPTGTTFVYRSPGMYNCVSAAVRMNTNILVFSDQHYESKDAALAYLKEMGLTDIADEATGSVILITPIDMEKGFGQADQYAFYLLQSAMCNIGYSIRGEDKTTYYADAGYMGGLTYRYIIGMDGGATFVNDYIASSFDYVSRIAGMLLVGGSMEKIRTVAAEVPVWLVNPGDGVAEKYAQANETDSTGRNGDDQLFYNSKHPLQQVIVTKTEKTELASLVHDAYYDMFTEAFRIPVVKGNLYTASNEFRDYKWDQAPYSLGKRNLIIDHATRDGLQIFERQEERFSDYKAENGEYITTWYEILPDEVLDGTADEHSVPLLLCNHGGGDDPIQAVEELGWLTLAGEERLAIVAERHSSENINAPFGSPSPWNISSEVLPQLVQYMLDTYPALDPSRVYVSGYSMGGSATNRAVYGDASKFAAAVNMSGTPYTYVEGQEKQFEKIDIPMMLTTCTYDTWTHFDSANGIIAEDFQMNINHYLKYNEMNQVEFDFEKYPISGFKGDLYRETTVNDEYPMHSWFFLNDQGAPMVGLTVIEYIPHGLYQEYARIAWDYMSKFTRNQETLEIEYTPWQK